MNTNPTPQMTSQIGRNERQKAKKIGKLAKDEHVQRLLSHYQLSLTEPMTAPLFGPKPFELQFYDDKHELTSQLVAPTLECLSQDLGLVDKGVYETIKRLKLSDHADFFRQQLFDEALKRGQKELNRYLGHLRPLLMDHEIYLYCTTPVSFQHTEAASGSILVRKGKRPLIALPASVHMAELCGYSDEQVRELAPQVAWLIPMLVVYRQVKETDQLIARLDGWLSQLSPQENEQLHTAFVKHVPYLVSKDVSRLLLPR